MRRYAKAPSFMTGGSPHVQEALRWMRFANEDLDVAAAKLESELLETVSAIRAGESIPADGSFVYVSRGPDLVVRRRCDLAEFARVAIVELEPARILAGG